MPEITLHPVTSSQIVAIGHDPETKTLAVKFKSFKPDEPDRLYHYAGVPAVVYAEMQKAESVGKYLNANIKTQFKHTRIS